MMYRSISLFTLILCSLFSSMTYANVTFTFDNKVKEKPLLDYEIFDVNGNNRISGIIFPGNRTPAVSFPYKPVLTQPKSTVIYIRIGAPVFKTVFGMFQDNKRYKISLNSYRECIYSGDGGHGSLCEVKYYASASRG